jgi:hypothetical protein
VDREAGLGLASQAGGGDSCEEAHFPGIWDLNEMGVQ